MNWVEALKMLERPAPNQLDRAKNELMDRLNKLALRRGTSAEDWVLFREAQLLLARIVEAEG